MVKFLHLQGANIRASKDYAIKRASKNGHLEVVKFLHYTGL